MQLQHKLSLGTLSRMEITAGAQCRSFLCQQERDVHKGKSKVTLQDTAAFHIMNCPCLWKLSCLGIHDGRIQKMSLADMYHAASEYDAIQMRLWKRKEKKRKEKKRKEKKRKEKKRKEKKRLRLSASI